MLALCHFSSSCAVLGKGCIHIGMGFVGLGRKVGWPMGSLMETYIVDSTGGVAGYSLAWSCDPSPARRREDESRLSVRMDCDWVSKSPFSCPGDLPLGPFSGVLPCPRQHPISPGSNHRLPSQPSPAPAAPRPLPPYSDNKQHRAAALQPPSYAPCQTSRQLVALCYCSLPHQHSGPRRRAPITVRHDAPACCRRTDTRNTSGAKSTIPG
ncbi:hypothetical protein CGRA01v4_07306 [Colletotrichum graminicola]|nr:hypothetical protein CGRA01v4_07306 [Colletotrichum graminicola]